MPPAPLHVHYQAISTAGNLNGSDVNNISTMNAVAS